MDLSSFQEKCENTPLIVNIPELGYNFFLNILNNNYNWSIMTENQISNLLKIFVYR